MSTQYQLSYIESQIKSLKQDISRLENERKDLTKKIGDAQAEALRYLGNTQYESAEEKYRDLIFHRDNLARDYESQRNDVDKKISSCHSQISNLQDTKRNIERKIQEEKEKEIKEQNKKEYNKILLENSNKRKQEQAERLRKEQEQQALAQEENKKKQIF